MTARPWVTSAANLLRLVRAADDAIGVALSFGKDSLAVLDLCCQIFPRVEGYYLFRVRGLEVVAEWAATVHSRYGVIVRMYPHFDLFRCYRQALLQPHRRALETTAKISMADIDAHFRQQTDVRWIAYGWRRNDSFSRTMIMKQCGGYDPRSRRVFPLRAWTRTQVLDYLTGRHISIPPGLGRKEQGGLDFHPEALRFLRDHYPDDWKLWLADFPLSEAQLVQQQGGRKPQAQSSPTLDESKPARPE